MNHLLVMFILMFGQLHLRITVKMDHMIKRVITLRFKSLTFCTIHSIDNDVSYLACRHTWAV